MVSESGFEGVGGEADVGFVRSVVISAGNCVITAQFNSCRANATFAAHKHCFGYQIGYRVNIVVVQHVFFQKLSCYQKLFQRPHTESLNTRYIVSFRFIDINECDLDLDNCHLNATCTNIGGSFSCTCPPSFSGDGISCAGRFYFITKKFSYLQKYVQANRAVI